MKTFLTNFRPKLTKLVQECSRKLSTDGEPTFPFNRLDAKIKGPNELPENGLGDDDITLDPNYFIPSKYTEPKLISDDVEH